jgi:5-methylcytosine-specific restriction protein A
VCGAFIRSGSRCPLHRKANRNTPEWRRLRRFILARDLWLCQIEGPTCTRDATCVDHIIPKIRGGTDHPSNLRAACVPCNALKGARMP